MVALLVGDNGGCGKALTIPDIPKVPDIPITYPAGIKNNTRATVGRLCVIGMWLFTALVTLFINTSAKRTILLTFHLSVFSLINIVTLRRA